MRLQRKYKSFSKKTKRRIVRFSIVTANFALLIGVGMAITHVSADPSNPVEVSKAQLAVQSSEETKPLDKLASTDVAVHVSRLVRMEEATAVTNKADTVSAELAVSSTDDQVLTKPQIVATALKSKKDIQKHTVVAGETVTSVAAKYGLTPDTIRFSNGISGEALEVGKVLTISPVNGITYVVKAGDTPDSLAARYNISKDQLIAFNDLELTGAFVEGDTIVIPDAVQPAEVRTASYGIGSRSSSAATYGLGYSFGAGPIYGGNGYDYGWCTWHAANRRIQNGNPLPTNLGNAISWLSRAQRAGLGSSGVPKGGAVAYHKNIGGLGHVAYVEKINEDGSALISDMNYPTWGRVTYRTVPPSEFGNYAFIY